MRRFMHIGWKLAVISVLVVAASVAHAQSASGQNFARLKADLDVVREDQRRLYGLIQEQEKRLDQVLARLQQIERRLGGVSDEAAVDTVAREQLAGLRSALAAETQARKAAIDQVVKQVSNELAALARKFNAVASGDGRAQSGGGGGGGEMTVGGWSGEVQGEYTVVAGDTLSTIAQAFGIGTRQLMKANSLTDDIIRVGQVLIIPKP